MTIAGIHWSGVEADRPAANSVLSGTLYLVTDATPQRVDRSNGSAWDTYFEIGGGSGYTTEQIQDMVAAMLIAGDDITITYDDGAGTVTIDTPTVGTIDHAYYARLASHLEPLAIEQIRKDTFSYVVASNATKYLIASWSTRIGAAGRLEVRDPRKPFALRGVTLAGTASGAIAAILDPTLPTYADARDTYFDRLLLLDDTAPKVINFTAPSQARVFLPGPYGSIITRVVNFDFTWITATIGYNAGGFNLANETGDTGSTDYQRNDNALTFPVSKNIVSGLKSGPEKSAGVGLGSVAYFICPSTWGAVADATSYNFRDDFMGATLDTTTEWTRAVSTAGNIEIDTAFAWLKVTGNLSWNTNGAFSQDSVARSAGKVFMCDVMAGTAVLTGGLAVGWHDGGGHDYTDFPHSVHFTNSAGATQLKVYEGGNDRGEVGTDYTPGYIYRVRITLGTSSAAYAIQGGPEYAALGGASWTDITPAVTSNSTTPLHAGISVTTNSTACYVGDVKVY